MPERRSPLILPPALAALLLVAFALSGLLLGLLTHGLVISAAAMPHATATATHARATATHTPPPPTPPPATGSFALSLTVSPMNVPAGGTLTVAAHADVLGTDRPLANLVCAVSGDGSGQDLLAAWPAPLPTDAQGNATWHLTVPAGAAGRYAIEVRARTSAYSAYQIIFISVTD
jgi:hypothetical protein